MLADPTKVYVQGCSAGSRQRPARTGPGYWIQQSVLPRAAMEWARMTVAMGERLAAPAVTSRSKRAEKALQGRCKGGRAR
jgi:hypothetical protein